jgi:hypothetical protein
VCAAPGVELWRKCDGPCIPVPKEQPVWKERRVHLSFCPRDFSAPHRLRLTAANSIPAIGLKPVLTRRKFAAKMLKHALETGHFSIFALFRLFESVAVTGISRPGNDGGWFALMPLLDLSRARPR